MFAQIFKVNKYQDIHFLNLIFNYIYNNLLN